VFFVIENVRDLVVRSTHCGGLFCRFFNIHTPAVTSYLPCSETWALWRLTSTSCLMWGDYKSSPSAHASTLFNKREVVKHGGLVSHSDEYHQHRAIRRHHRYIRVVVEETIGKREAQ